VGGGGGTASSSSHFFLATTILVLGSRLIHMFSPLPQAHVDDNEVNIACQVVAHTPTALSQIHSEMFHIVAHSPSRTKSNS
jgi:hypothetical protein